MKNAKWIILFGFIAACTSAAAQAAVDQKASDQAPNYIMCRNQKTVRTIRIEKDDNKTWVAVYTKAGVDKEVGRAQNYNSCVKIADNIRVNLDKAGWKCKEVTNVGMTGSADEN